MARPRQLHPLTAGRGHGLATREAVGILRGEPIAEGEGVRRVGGVEVGVTPQRHGRKAPIRIRGVSPARKVFGRLRGVEGHLAGLLLGHRRNRHQPQRERCDENRLRCPHVTLLSPFLFFTFRFSLNKSVVTADTQHFFQ